MSWSVETLDSRVDDELSALPADMRARFVRIAQLVEAVGLERVGMPHVRHLEGPLWEMRMSGRDGIARGLYVTKRGRRMIVLRVFVKKSQKTPRREIDAALARMQELDR